MPASAARKQSRARRFAERAADLLSRLPTLGDKKLRRPVSAARPVLADAVALAVRENRAANRDRPAHLRATTSPKKLRRVLRKTL